MESLGSWFQMERWPAILAWVPVGWPVGRVSSILGVFLKQGSFFLDTGRPTASLSVKMSGDLGL